VLDFGEKKMSHENKKKLALQILVPARAKTNDNSL
jgi:hypothetical protein